VVHWLEKQPCDSIATPPGLLRDLFLWGLQDRLLDMVTAYLGLPPLYLVVMWVYQPVWGGGAGG
jgi:hypothetical protein